jgi:diguanylate cyclase
MCSASTNDPQHSKDTPPEADEPGGASGQAERLLCRAMIRLTLATGGLDPRIDPYLTQVRDLLRKGIAKRYSELDTLSETLLRESKSAAAQAAPSPLKPQQAALLFRFLKDAAGSDAERSALAAVESKVERGEIGEAGLLYTVLRDVLRHAPAPQAGPESEAAAKRGWFGRILSRNSKAEGWVEVDLVRDRLLGMLDAIDIPLSFQERGEAIKGRLQAGLRGEDIPGLINEAIDFLIDVRAYIQREQQEIEDFLAALNGRLTDLESQTLGMDATAQAIVQDREAEDSSFGRQFHEFRATAEKAPDLAQLRMVVAQRLEKLDHQYRSSRQREMDRLLQTQEQLGKLTGRLQDLELETNELRTKLRLAHDQALRDPLTGLPNRKAYDERLAQEIARWKRFQHPLTLLVWDIDRFKGINDRYGHTAGDKVLVNVALALAESIRETDIVARYGGEEFATILCGASGVAALRVAEQIRQNIAHCGFNSLGKPVQVTVSCGLSEYRNGDTADGLFERADKALYEAKQTGRNRCVLI